MAPVYRNIDTGGTFLGLAFPGEVLLIMGVFWVTAWKGEAVTSLLVTGGAYVTLRVSTYGKPPNHLQHLMLFHLRRSSTGAAFAPGARAAVNKRFPFGATNFREPAQRRREH